MPKTKPTAETVPARVAAAPSEPPPQELTGAQLNQGMMSGMIRMGSTFIPTGTYQNYRKMRDDPTIALARMIVMGPIIASEWSVQQADGVPDEWSEFIKDAFVPLRPMIIADALRGGLDFGWQGWEEMFKIVTKDGKQRVTVAKFKALLHDITEIAIDKETGRFGGFIQPGGVEVPVEKSLLYTHDREGDNHYGRSRMENVRRAVADWNECAESANRYDTKISGVMVVVHYPPGESRDRTGALVNNSVIASRLLAQISAGKGMAVPNEFASDVDNRSESRQEKRRWIIEFKEDKGGREAGFASRMEYLDKLKFRGWLRPERSGLEGNTGTLAEAVVHADVGLTDGELLHQDITRTINWHAVDQLLVLNFGEEARGKVWLQPAPLADEKRAIYRELLKALATSPQGIEDLRLWVDWDSILDMLDVPKTEQTIEAVDANVDPGNPKPTTGVDPNSEEGKAAAALMAKARPDPAADLLAAK